MPKIYIDTHNRIISYGNPAGYISSGKAVADTIFQTGELEAFLSKQNLETEWRDGIYDRLVLGQQSGFDPEAPTLKNCRIWQLTSDTPVDMRFINYDAMVRKFGEPTPAQYAPVYDGQVDTNDLEGIYDKFSTPQPGFNGHPMAISDVVELYDESGSEFHYCDRTGFREISFSQPQQTQTMQMTM
ncbi:MAG TPA: hypothetical protein DD735_01190 [Clostridiales bacterium]|jgi:hypothetical protein|nr:hypothetical protein [Clostridiales bacterium]